MNIYDEIIDFLEEKKMEDDCVELDPSIYTEFNKKVSNILENNKASSTNINASAKTKNPVNVNIKNEKNIDFSMHNFESLEKTALTCTRCALHKSRKNVVFGEGNISAELMFIGEGPGRDEDLQGRPFVGKSGQLLTKMIKAMGFDRQEVYIANIVKCRPPFNRNPNPDEAKYCLGYLNRQIELIKPKVLILLGAVPLHFLLGKSGIKRLHGNWQEYRGIKTMPTFHPAFLLRDSSQKKYAWEDLKKVMRFIGKL